MLAPLFHHWERRLASVAKDRVVRPFEWGMDWIDVPVDDAQPRFEESRPGGSLAYGAAGSDGRIEAHVVRAWVDAVMADTRAFFHTLPAREYEFHPRPAAARGHGEAGTLRYPSAMHTPHASNNTVEARWFPAAGEGSLDPRGTRGRAVVVLPQWNADAGGHIGLSRLLGRFGISALRLSLPYHDVRMPSELNRADFIVSSNVVRTVQVCRQAVLDVRRAVAWLSLLGFDRIGLLGTSLGSCLAMLTAAHEPRVRAQALNHVSPHFADVVWRGLSTQHVRASLDGVIDLETLRALWRPISPFSYLEQVRGVRTLLVYAKYDLTFPLDLSLLLVDEFERRSIPHEVAALPCGHYSTGVAPFKFMDGYLLTRFLLRAL